MTVRSSLVALIWLVPLVHSAALGQSADEALRRMKAEADSAISAQQSVVEATLDEWKEETRAALRAWMQGGSRGAPETTSSPEKTSAAERASPTDEPSPSTEESAATGERVIASEATPSGASESGLAPAPDASPTYSKVPASRRGRAEPYRKLIRRYSRAHDVPTTLTLAITDAESFFNPSAVSEDNCIGLMQICPPSGGKLAYKAAYGEAVVPSEEYLKKPKNNVELGTKLLQLLLHLERFFREVQSPWSRQLLATAAYNCGATCVARRLTDQGSVEAAVALANSLRPRGVYERLRKALPAETRRYLRRVFSRRTYYWAWRGEGEQVYGIPPRTSK